MNKKGFTLAEVLITLAILSIVISVTVPTLIKNVGKRNQELAIKNTYTMITEAIHFYLADQETPSLLNTPIVNNQGKLRDFVNNYFKVVNYCGEDYGECFPAIIKALHNNSIEAKFANRKCMVVVALANNVSMCVNTGRIEGDGFDPDRNKVMEFEVDTNGINGPNVSGRDIFEMSVDSSGRVYGDYNSEDRTGFIEMYETSASPMPIGLIQAENWKMNY